MTKFYVELQDNEGTCYGTTYPRSNETMYFDDLDEARMYVKSKMNTLDWVTVARVIETGRRGVRDYFVREIEQ